MVLSRRQTLQVAGAAIFGGFLAGCISNGDPGGDGENDPVENGSSEEKDEMPINGRLHNETGEKQTFAVTIRNEDGEEVVGFEPLLEELPDGLGFGTLVFGRKRLNPVIEVGRHPCRYLNTHIWFRPKHPETIVLRQTAG